MAPSVGRTLRTLRLRMQEPLAVTIAVAVVLVAVLPPFLAVGLDLLEAHEPLGLIANASLWLLLLRSLTLSSVVTLLSLIVGVPLGVLFARAEFPLRRLLFAAHAAIFFLPPFLPALGWFHWFGREGFVGSDFSARVLFGMPGIVLVLVCSFTPVVTMLTALGVSNVDRSLEDAARIVARPFRVAAFILVPCAAPIITLAALIVFTLAFSELGVPMFLRVQVYPAVVFARLGGMDFAPGEAAVFVVPLILVSIVLLAIERRFAGRRAIAALSGGTRALAPLFAYRPWIFGIAAFAAIVSLLPLVALLFHAATRGGFGEAWRWVGDAPWNGLRASILAAVVMTAIALILGRAFARRERVGVWLDAAATLAFMLPSAVLGVGIIAAWNRPATNWLYGSFGVLVLGFVARYTVLATRTFAASIAQIPISLEEAAKTVGAGYLRRLLLLGNLCRRGLIGAFMLGVVFSLRDLETAVLFYPPGGEPLTVRIFTLEANGPPAVVSALALLHVFITFAVVSVAWLALRPRSVT